MADLQRGTALVMPTEAFSTQDYEQGKFVVSGGSIVSVRITGGGQTGTAGTAIAIPVAEQYAPLYEDNTAGVAGIMQKPVASSTYAPSEFTSFGAAAGTGVAVKASAGNIYSVYVTSAAAAIRYFQIFNSATALANGGTPVASYPLGSVPAGGIYELNLPTTHFAPSRYMSTGIAVAISSTNGTLGTASVTASEHNIHIKYV